MQLNLTQKLIKNHLVEGEMHPGNLVGVKFDQTLCQDATGTLVMLALEAMELDKVRTEVSAQYVDHNLLQEDSKNQDDHLFLLSAAQRFGVWFSRPGNGISHPLHMQRFGRPGATLIGSDSHTCAGGSLGMFAIGAGGADVAMAMAGQPVFVPMPEVWGVRLEGALPYGVSAKDIILEMLRRHGVSGGVGRSIEYYGPGLINLSAMDRHVIANMGAELGATATVFPSDEQVHNYLQSEGRSDSYQPLEADKNCSFQHHDIIQLDKLVPLIAKPSSPGNVVPVSDVVGEPIHQAYIGSSANPGYHDYITVAEILKNETVPAEVSLDINPSSRQVLQALSDSKYLNRLLEAGARLHQAGCNGCIGMGQAPATQKNSLRTTPRNFPGRSGTKEDCVWLCSPETAAASARNGKITDPRTIKYDASVRKKNIPTKIDQGLWVKPAQEPNKRTLIRGPNIAQMPEQSPLSEHLTLPFILSLGSNVSTDEILPAGAQVLPYRSNIPKISQFSFHKVAPNYVEKAKETKHSQGHAILAGENYGQGSSREHAALAPRYLGLRAVVAKSFARIHKQNLINFGVLPLSFEQPSVFDVIDERSTLTITHIKQQLQNQLEELERAGRQGNYSGREYLLIDGEVSGGVGGVKLIHNLYPRDIKIILAGGLIPWLKSQLH